VEASLHVTVIASNLTLIKASRGKNSVMKTKGARPGLKSNHLFIYLSIMKRIFQTKEILLSLFVILLLCCFSNSNTLKESGASIIPIKTLSPDSNFSDLMPLIEIFKGKKVIGAGEATHGTEEFAQIKHRLFKFLVLNMKVKTLAIEMSYSNCLELNEYIVNDRLRSTKDELYDNMSYSIFQTDECLSLFEWMHNYNLKIPSEDKLRLIGFDKSLKCSLAFLQANLGKSYQTKEQPFLNKFQADSIVKAINSKFIATNIKKQTIDSLLTFISKTNSELAYDTEESAHIKRTLEELKQSILDMFSRDDQITFRDSCMAQNIYWITSQYPGETIMAWAHNGHIKAKEQYFKKYGQYKTMGKFLKEIFKEKYYPIGLEFNQGSFLALDGYENGAGYTTTKCSLIPKKNSLAFKFSKFNLPYFYLDFLTQNKRSKIYKLISSDQYLHDIGFNCKNQEDAFYTEVVKDIYDGLIYIEKSSYPNITFSKESFKRFHKKNK
jgi:erythromycin esterase